MENCDINLIHEEIVKKVLAKLPKEEFLTRVAETYKLFGDPTRVRILYALSLSEMCVCDLSALLEMSQSAISHQLRLLKAARLVSSRREGKVVYYSLDDDHVKLILNTGLVHIMEEEND